MYPVRVDWYSMSKQWPTVKGGRTSPREYRTRRLGSLGRLDTSVIWTGRGPLLKSDTVCRSRSSRRVATPKSTWQEGH